jgi:3-hydroxy-3-methylglutaryl CoA synthase
MRPDRPRVGIEKIWAYPGTQALDLLELGTARDHDPADLRDNLLVLSRSVNPLWEDPVTMAVNAAQPMLSAEDRETIELLIVATESSVDQGKSISTFAQRHLEIQPNCRNYESKQACYGGTCALMMAAHWIASGAAGGKKALVIATDQSRESIGEPFEYVMGAGAVALLVSDNPRVLELDLEHNGYWTQEVSDTFRPTTKVETGNGETSLYCYIDALEGAYAHFLSKAGDIDFDTYFKKHIYHVPFGGITFQAHRTLLRQWKRLKKSEAYDHFSRTSKPGLKYNSQMGGTYSGSTFLALMGMIDSCDDLHPGDRISIFSYGSGSCGEFYSAVIGPDARELVAKADLQGLLDDRHPVTVEQYEALERGRTELIDQGTYTVDTSGFDDLFQRRYTGQKRLMLKGNADHYREYGWG